MNESLRIEYVDIDSITPYERNAKQHPAEQIEQIKRSIQEFGFNDPIAVWHGECVEGHGRIMAAKELGYITVPIIRLDNLTDEERRAYALVHNKLTMNSGFDLELLDLELGEIDLEMERFGFQTSEHDEEPDDLDAPEDDTKTVVRLVFEKYKDYAIYETAIKEFAEKIGASITIGK